MSNYDTFLATKVHVDQPSGIEASNISSALYPFESDIVTWAVRRGRAAIFADCGLGKTIMQIEWARQLGQRTLFVAPLGVTAQTIDEANRLLGMTVVYVTEPTDDQYQITNYERIKRFVGADYGSIVLDESSILKSLDGKTKKILLDEFKSVPYRLCCTATPAPNDLAELGNHSDFLGALSFREMSATFFVKDSNSSYWRLKGYARDAFFKWMTSWAVFVRKPSDLGHDDDGFALPELRIHEEIIEADFPVPGRLFPGALKGITERSSARKLTAKTRVEALTKIIEADSAQWIVWCGLNDESTMIHKALNSQSVEIAGSTDADKRHELATRWMAGDVRVLVTKPKIYGFGMNFQYCHKMAFLGIGDSYEQYYQAIRRCWRYGQTKPVDVTVVSTTLEECIVANIHRKEKQAETLSAEMVEAWKSHGGAEQVQKAKATDKIDHTTADARGEHWSLMLGDSCERLKELTDEAVDMSVFSPPFVSLYTYTATPRDIGNSRTEPEFFEHFSYIIEQLYRVTKPGRECCVHVTQIPAMLVRDGYIGLKDFRARTVEAFQAHEWVYHGEVVIDKDPQAQAIRTKSKSLLFTQLRKDASWLRPALADYILVFRKPGQPEAPIKPDITNNDWIEWARPIWYGIREIDTLQFRLARTDKDERHICPLQLGVIERCIRLWSNPGDLILSPFAGIGSEGYMAVKLRRRFVGVELKPEYFNIARQNLEHAEREQGGLFK